MFPKFRKIVDLTKPIVDRMAVYPGDPLVAVTEVAHRETDGFAVAAIHLNDHTGTHMETQAHMIPGKCLADELPERFLGTAAVVAVRGPSIAIEDLAPAEPLIRRNPFVLLFTGYTDRRSDIDPHDPQRPIIGLQALEWLCDKGIQLLGIDAFDFDSGPPYPGHRLLFKRNVLVIEGLVGLAPLSAREVTLIALPLKIAGTGGSPCRVLALVE